MSPFRFHSHRKFVVATALVIALALGPAGAGWAAGGDDRPDVNTGQGPDGVEQPDILYWNYPIPPGERFDHAAVGYGSSVRDVIADALDPNECELPMVPEVVAFQIYRVISPEGGWEGLIFYDCVWGGDAVILDGPPQ